MKKRLSLSSLEVQSFVTGVEKVVAKGGSDEETFRLACTAEHCSNASCPGAYCPDRVVGQVNVAI